MRRVRGEDHPQRDVVRGQVQRADREVHEQVLLRDQQPDDDAHRLLGVVAAMAERERRGREQLQDPEGPVHGAGQRAAQSP